jgi:tetratricopeptide (TPR) repeat protein
MSREKFFFCGNPNGKFALVKFRRKRYDSVMLRVVLLCVPLVLAVGCLFSRSVVQISPGQYFGSERAQQGIAAMERGNLSEAEKRLEDAVRYNKNDINHRQHYAEVLWKQGKHQEALEQLDEALKRGGQNNASLHISLAEKYLAISEYQTAYHHADEAVRLDSQDYRSWALRGRAKRLQASQPSGYAEHSLAMLHQAREDYLRAVSLSPNNRELLAELAVVQMGCQQPEQALATWLTLQSLYPQGSEPDDVLLGKTETLMVLRRFDEAESNLLAMRQRGLEHSEAGRRLQAMIVANQTGVRR